ncbi:MAG: hypothetical protein ABH842_03470 [Candidatus Micrarchaeota archaeon]
MVLICGVLESEGKVYFLKKNGKLELPHVFGDAVADPIGQLAEGFRKQTDIKVNFAGIILQTKIGISSCIVCKVVALDTLESNREHVWLSMEDAKQQQLGESTMWMKM